MCEGAATLTGTGTYFFTVCAVIWNMFKLVETMTDKTDEVAFLYTFQALCVFKL
jgi:hypothetical protein